MEIRVHSFFLLLLLLSASWAAYLQRPLLRGFALWCLIVVAVAVREIARGFACAWYGLAIKSVLLLPTGGILSYSSATDLQRSGEARPGRLLALAGPVANVIFGLTLGALVLTVSPKVDLIGSQWVTPAHLLRAMVWVNLLLAVLNLLPAWPLDGAGLMKRQMVSGSTHPEQGSAEPLRGSTAPQGGRGMRALALVGPGLAIALMLVGIVTVNFWLIMAGVGVMIGAQVERQGALVQTDGELVQVREVMLTEYSILSASATLEDALDQARHTLQDVFPVVRGGNMVGAVSRQSIMEALGSTGNGYVQGIMTRMFQTATPEDSLLAALSRVTGAGGSSQLVPVIEGERIVGIMTPQNLQRSMSLLARRRQTGASGTRDSGSRNLGKRDAPRDSGQRPGSGLDSEDEQD